MCFVWKRKCDLFLGGKRIIAEERADNPLQYDQNDNESCENQTHKKKYLKKFAHIIFYSI